MVYQIILLGKRFNYSLQKPGGCSLTLQLNCLFLIFTNDSIIILLSDREQVDKQLAVIPIESSLVLGENFYNTKTREIYSYELWNDSSVQKPNISAFDYNTPIMASDRQGTTANRH